MGISSSIGTKIIEVKPLEGVGIPKDIGIINDLNKHSDCCKSTGYNNAKIIINKPFRCAKTPRTFVESFNDTKHKSIIVPTKKIGLLERSEITLDDVIGEGTSGKVYKGTCRDKNVAVKVIKVDPEQQDIVDRLRNEIEVMSGVNHENICQYMGSCMTLENDLMIITQLKSKSLADVLYDNTILSLSDLIRIALDVALGLSWLHHSNPKIIHADVKAANILLDDDCNGSVADFGQALFLQGDNAVFDGGSPLYMAPERFENGTVSDKADVYSFGILLWEMVYRKIAFSEFNNIGIVNFVGHVCSGGRPNIDNACPISLSSLITNCWHQEPALRPSFSIIVDELKKCLLEITITDYIGQQFWNKYFELKSYVSWNDFKCAFREFSQTNNVFWLKPLLVEKRYIFSTGIVRGSTEVTSPYISTPLIPKMRTESSHLKNRFSVSMKRFGDILSAFGPWKKENVLFTDEIEKILKCPWFHGDIDRENLAKRFRYDSRIGSFAVRFGTGDAHVFILNYISETNDKDCKTKSIFRMPIVNTSNGYMFNHIYYQSLVDVIEENKKNFPLKFPLNGSQYMPLVEKWTLKNYETPPNGKLDYYFENTNLKSIKLS